MLGFEAGPVRVRVALSGDSLLFGADGPDQESAEEAITQMRFALGVDDDLSEFHRLFSSDPVIGRSVRRRPHLRPHRRPRPWEALAWAVTEQLIEYVRAAAIQRRLVRRAGARHNEWGLSDVPTPQAIAALAPAELVALDLAASRAITLRTIAAAVADGRVVFGEDRTAGERASQLATVTPTASAFATTVLSAPSELLMRSLTRFTGIGTWTAEITALHGVGDFSVVPAGDLNYMKAVGRRISGGDPKAVASEAEVRAFFEPYAPWGGLAAAHFVSA